MEEFEKYLDSKLEKSEDKTGVMVYGKDYISDLINQLKQRYDGKVNIYIAK